MSECKSEAQKESVREKYRPSTLRDLKIDNWGDSEDGSEISKEINLLPANQWCHAVGARGSAAPIVFQLAGAPLPYFVNIFELVNDKYCTI